MDTAIVIAGSIRMPGGQAIVSISHEGRLPERVVGPRGVLLRPTETVPVSDAAGRIAADVHIGCPPAVLPVVPGERVDRNAIAVMEYYGIQSISVLK